MGKIEMSLNKPRELIFINIPKDINITNKERLIYNYILYKLQNEKIKILNEKQQIEEIGIDYMGYVLKLSLKDIKRDLKIHNNKEITNMLNNLRKVDFQGRKEVKYNVGRLEKTAYYDNLIGWVDVNETKKEEEYFKLSISKNLIQKVVIEDLKDYVKLFLKDMVEFKSKHSLTMFEILKSSYNEYWKNNIPLKLTLEDFKELFNLNEKYSISNIKKRVLEIAKDELKEKTDYEFEYNFETGDVGKNYRFIVLSFNAQNTQKRKSYLSNKKLKNINDKEMVDILKERNEYSENKTIKKLEEENNKLKRIDNKDKEEIFKQLEYWKRLANMAIDKADAEHQKELEEKEQKGITF